MASQDYIQADIEKAKAMASVMRSLIVSATIIGTIAITVHTIRQYLPTPRALEHKLEAGFTESEGRVSAIVISNDAFRKKIASVINAQSAIITSLTTKHNILAKYVESLAEKHVQGIHTNTPSGGTGSLPGPQEHHAGD